MCIIIAGSKRKPTLDTLRRCEKANGDGAGVAWATEGGKVRYIKDVTAEEAHDHIRAAPGAWTAHFRIATVGGARSELIHPFPVTDEVELQDSGETDTVLFHNGTYGDWRDSCMTLSLSHEGAAFPLGPMSDSRAIAWMVHHKGPGILALMRTGRYLLLTGSGYLVLPSRKEWYKDRGIWYSNATYKAHVTMGYGQARDSTTGKFASSAPPSLPTAAFSGLYHSRRVPSGMRVWHEEAPTGDWLKNMWDARQRSRAALTN